MKRAATTTGPATARRALPVLALALALACHAAAQPEAGPEVELIWKSGEKLPGRALAAGPDTLSFQPRMPGAPGLFPEPAELRLEHLRELHRTGGSGPERTEAFEVRLRDGGRLLADLTGVENDRLLLRSALLGEFALDRQAVAGLERVRGPGVVFSAGGADTHWTESLRLERGEPPFQDPFAPAALQAPRVWRVNRSPRSGPHAPDEPQLWTRQPGGGFATWSWSNTLSTLLAKGETAALPESLRLDARLGSDTAPRFSLKLALPDTEVRVETWDDRLVLRQGARFAASPQPLAKKPAELGLTILWDRRTGEARLLDAAGTALAVLPAEPEDQKTALPKPSSRRPPPPERPAGPLIALENLGHHLALHALTLTQWDGALPRPSPAVNSPGARLLDGQTLAGTLAACDDSTITFQRADGATESIPLEKILTIQIGARVPPPAAPKARAPSPVPGARVPPPAAPKARAPSPAPGARVPSPAAPKARSPSPVPGARVPSPAGITAHLSSPQGEFLRGTFEGISKQNPNTPPLHETTIQLRHPAFAAPLHPRLAALESVVWETPGNTDTNTEAEKLTDRLRVDTQSVRGRMIPAGDPLPRWLFDGALKPVPLGPDQRAVIERDERHVAPPQDVADLVLLQMKSGDLVAARLRELRTDGVLFAAPGVMSFSLPPAELDAVLFPGRPLLTEGFADPDWQWLAGGDEPPPGSEEDGAVVLQPGQALAHPAMMEGGSLDFTLHDESGLGMTCLRLGLFARHAEAAGEHLKLLLAFVGDEIYCGDEAGDGQMRRQRQVPREEGPARVQIRLHEQRLLVRVNDVEALSLDVTTSMRPGSGLILESSGLWGNPPQAVRLREFAARPRLQRLRVPQVDEEARRQAMTIPRARAGEPPGHVLVAPSGDLLRGTLEHLDDDAAVLRWGLETLRVPRQRLAAVILLDEPADAAAATDTDPAAQKKQPEPRARPAAPGAPHWLLLANGGRLGLKLLRWAEDGVTGLHPRLGRVRLPAESVQALWTGQPPPVTDAMRAVTGWQPVHAQAPEIPDTPAAESPLVGTEAKDFTLPLLDGEDFHLHEQRGKVVVLDFWATWCAPCIKALPELMEALKDLPSDQVRLIGVNQGEPAEQARTFLTTRNWPLTTVLDTDQTVGRQFGAESIPHTVVIAPDGKIALVKTGYTPEAAREIAAKVAELLRGE